MCYGYIQIAPHPDNFLCGRHNRIRRVQHLAHGVSAGGMPKRTMFQFTLFPDHCPFTISFDLVRTAQKRNELFCHL